MDFEEIFVTFLIFGHRNALYCWKPCSIVYSRVKCQMHTITLNLTALLSIPIPRISHQQKSGVVNIILAGDMNADPGTQGHTLI